MNISPVNPIGPAWQRMVRTLFKPFHLSKWFLLGFCVFLAQCGENGNNLPIGDFGGGGGGGGGGGQQTNEFRNWLNQNMIAFIVGVVCIILFVIVIGLLITWISSRGKFMFLDGVVRNRGAVQEPWREYRREGNSLFVFRIVLLLISLLGFVIAVGIPLLIAIPDLSSQTLGPAGIVAIIVGVFLVLAFIVVAMCVKFFVDAFLTPTMYLRRVRALAGCKIAWHELVRGHIGPAILLFLMLFVFGIATAIITTVVTCLSCCLTAVPYLGSVLLLPIPVFFTAYILEYIQQFGDDWQFFPDMCSKCGYLRAPESSDICPECGHANTAE